MTYLLLQRVLRQRLWIVLFLLWKAGTCVCPVQALTSEEENTTSIYEEVADSIVNITSTSVQQDFFFLAVPMSGSGSGIILKEDGTIVTNHHVVDGARGIEVTLVDGTHWEAKLIGSAPQRDLAIIRIDVGNHPLKPIAMGDSDSLSVGQKVLAIGNPFGLGHTLTSGTVSMLGRNIRHEGVVLEDLIQTDASINPGNSGGALVNSEGQLIGINTAIFSPTGSSIGIGFAIPVNHVKKAVPGIIDTWGKWVGWALALLLVFWVLRRIYRVR